MNIQLVLVSSINGKLTNNANDSIYEWTSKEDQDFFFDLIAQQSLIIMGRKTYEAAKGKIRLTPKTLRIVFTHNPNDFKKDRVLGQLEFSNESPEKLIQRLEKKGYTQGLLVGGNELATNFLAKNLVDQLYITLEPYLFGKGTLFIDYIDTTVSLKLVSVEQLNQKGTLLAQYKIIKK